MDVEILGTLKDAIGPGQDMILGRLHGTKPEFTGVVAGMSGSPVYIDGKLLGALSFRIGQFSKEPICGITPIGLMFEVRDLPAATPATAAPATHLPDGAQPIATPLVFSGFGAQALSLYGDGFRQLGLEPVAGLGSAAPQTAQPEPIIPGSAVSAMLARGDLNIAATCTVTYVDDHQLLACGHPITQYGTIDLPMTKAEVLATLPSPHERLQNRQHDRDRRRLHRGPAKRHRGPLRPGRPHDPRRGRPPARRRLRPASPAPSL